MDKENPFRDQDPSQNPYATFSSPTAPPGKYAFKPNGMVGHVRIVSILMMVQGGLVGILGLLLAGMGIVMPLALQNDPNFQRNMDGGPPMWVLFAIYGGMGAVGIALGLLYIVAGVKNYRFRSRTFGIVAMSVGVLSAMTCYCAPTAIGLLIYGLIVYLNPPVMAAFELGQQGRSADEILGAFYSGTLPGSR